MITDLHQQAGAHILKGVEPRPFWFLPITAADLDGSALDSHYSFKYNMRGRGMAARFDTLFAESGDSRKDGEQFW